MEILRKPLLRFGYREGPGQAQCMSFGKSMVGLDGDSIRFLY